MYNVDKDINVTVKKRLVIQGACIRTLKDETAREIGELGHKVIPCQIQDTRCHIIDKLIKMLWWLRHGEMYGI